MKKIMIIFISVLLLLSSCKSASPQSDTLLEDTLPPSPMVSAPVTATPALTPEKPSPTPEIAPPDTPTATATPTVNPSIEPTGTPQIAIDEALRLYLDYIDELKNDDFFNDFDGSMSLIFIDDDDIPELVIDRSYPHYGIIICTVSNGAVETILAEGGSRGIYYIEKGSKFAYTAIIQNLYYDVVCCIEDGTFVTLHEGFHDAGKNQYFWDGEEVSYSEYHALHTETIDYSEYFYTGMSSIRTADMIYEINAQLSDSPPDTTAAARDPISGLLTSEGAFAIYSSWQADHPEMSLISRQSRIYEYHGEQYYHFPAKDTSMYFFNILVHTESGMLLNMMITDGMTPYTLIEPLDNWYRKNYNRTDSTQTLDIIDHYGPPVSEDEDIIGVGVIGTVVSSCPILSVSVMVYKDSGEVETGKSVYPNTNTYDLNQLEADLHLDTLTPGMKRYVIEATDETGTITLQSWFRVD